MDVSLLWIPATLAAAAAQTGRNVLQRGLSARIGTLGATQTRFVYGLPFAALFLALVAGVGGEAPPTPTAGVLGFVLLGALAQIAATALMLAAMRERSFAVVTAYLKTEPVQTALIGAAVLGDALTLPMLAAILVASAGVLLAGSKPGSLLGAGARPALLGIAAGGLFGLAATSFRGGILAFEEGSFLLRATTALVLALALQSALLLAWLAAFDRAALLGSLRAWRGSVGAGFLGALASQLWFVGFALTSAAAVRTLALVEAPMAFVVSRRLLRQETSRREIAGMILVVAGVAGLLWSLA